MLLSRFLVMTVFIPAMVHAQDKPADGKEEFHRNQVMFGLNHTHVPSGSQNGEKKWLVLASLSLDYNFWINPRWAVGLHNDVVAENYEVEHNEVILERKRPITSLLTAVFKPGKHFGYMLGMGGEFAEGETFLVNRLSIEYGHEFGNSWEVNVGLMYDIKWNGYNSYALGIGISKLF